MSEDDAKALGAKPTEQRRHAPASVQVDGGRLDLRGAVPRGQGGCGNPVCEYERSAPRAQVFDDLRAQDCMPITVQPAMGHADLYQLAAQGKSDDECWTAMRKRLNVFSTATEGPVPSCSRRRAFFGACLHRSKILPKRKPSSLNIPPIRLCREYRYVSEPADLSAHFLGFIRNDGLSWK